MGKTGIDVVTKDPTDNPRCPHGPTLLFSRKVKGRKEVFFACAANRDRKDCNFFLRDDDVKKYNSDLWKQKEKQYLKGSNHRKKFMVLNEIKKLSSSERKYCHNCMQFQLKDDDKHKGHHLVTGITDFQLQSPTEILPPLENSKVQAQYLFSKSSVKDIVFIIKTLGYRHIICIGTPRLHEYLINCPDMTSILLDFDKRFHNFFGPLEFCWYNLFNNHFFNNGAKNVFEDFLQKNNGRDTLLIMDPPFGGRTEPIVFTLNAITSQFRKLNSTNKELPIFWIFPYFMEPQILNGLPNFHMLDYKVEYENHVSFHGKKIRKQGSPVRIFTNVNRLIKLPGDGYRYCKLCKKWVALDNKHCDLCQSCTSKDGRTYKHCYKCNRCVKPIWKHCDTCNRCALPDHKCELIVFTKECFSCGKTGHKKSECPYGDSSRGKKRLTEISVTSIKKKKKKVF